MAAAPDHQTLLAHDHAPAPDDTVLVEVGYEVCNPVGGIYQVLRSKAATMVERWHDRYLMVGPWFEAKSSLEIEPDEPDGLLAEVSGRLNDRGVACRTGRWLIGGRPRTILLDPDPPRVLVDETRHILETELAVPTASHEALVDQVLAFTASSRLFFQAACEVLGPSWSDGPVHERGVRRLLAHLHEWMSGPLIPLFARDRLPIATVFTTHATMVGRYLAGSQEGFDPTSAASIDAEAESARLGIVAQHRMEHACAHAADAFTTVSEVTAEECRLTLGRSPDRALPNGLNVAKYNVGHEFQTLHAVFKEQIEAFVMAHFFPSYSFDLANTRYIFTSGRFEPRNKGFDLCLEAMARLNVALKAAESELTVVFFIITRRPTRSLHPEVLRMRGVLQELREVCTRITADVGDKLYHLAATRQPVDLDDLVEEYWALRLRRTQAALQTETLPLLTTHVLESEHDDGVLNHIRHLGLENRPEDPVKIVYSPDFITPTSPIWGMEYDQFVRGCHLGLFPSTYEPWGYTPPECLALGVPAITTDLSGFGRYAGEHPGEGEYSGWAPSILPRRGRSFHDAAAILAHRLFEFCALDRRERIALRNAVEARSWDFDWSRLGGAYHEVHDLALRRAAGRLG